MVLKRSNKDKYFHHAHRGLSVPAKSNGKKDSEVSRPLDNPLFDSTEKQLSKPPVASHTARRDGHQGHEKPYHASHKKLHHPKKKTRKAPAVLKRSAPEHHEIKELKTALAGDLSKPLTTEEETTNVLDIVSDVEQQFDNVFVIEKAQADEINKLKKKLKEAYEKIAGFKDPSSELEAANMSVEELKEKVEFLENEKIELYDHIKKSRLDLQKQTAKYMESEKAVRMVHEETRSFLERIEYFEAQLGSVETAHNNLKKQNMLLKNEIESLVSQAKTAEQEKRHADAETEKTRIDLEKAKESLDQIRLMISRTKVKTGAKFSNS